MGGRGEYQSTCPKVRSLRFSLSHLPELFLGRRRFRHLFEGSVVTIVDDARVDDEGAARGLARGCPPLPSSRARNGNSLGGSGEG